MKASRLHDHGHALEPAGDQQAFVPGHAGLGKSRDRVVLNANRIDDFVGKESETRAEHDGDARPEFSQAPRHRLYRCCDRSLRSRSSLRSAACFRQSRIPASVAERKLASVPAIMARKPSRARSCLRSGARAPMPPIWMPIELRLAKPQSANVANLSSIGIQIELRLAKPQSANVAMVNDSGSRLAFIVPRSA